MCGITGIASFSGRYTPDARILSRMAATLRHRGPDELAIDIQDDVGLGIQRLAVIDVQGGHQPVKNEDGSVRVVFNGEIYNFRSLREKLVAAGHRFSSRSDTEVIVHAYEEYGAAFPEHLNGMFAIALHDAARRRLLLVRDPIGIKPLYYAMDRDRIVWGSEIKAILASGAIPRELDMSAVAEFLTWEYVPGAATLFKSVRKLKPGEMLDLNLDDPVEEPRCYWRLLASGNNRNISDREWEERTEDQLRRSIEAQMVSDVPLGAFLSGGVDSSLIVSSMGSVKTFSIGFDDPSYNELPWARMVADHLGVRHSEEIISSGVVDLFEPLMEFLDDPIGDFSIFPTYLISRLARQQVTVALSGDGGDELFGGYETYTAQLLARKYGLLPDILRSRVVEPLARSLAPRPTKKGLANMSRRFAEGMSHPAALGHARWRMFMSEAGLDRLFTPEANAARSRDAGAHIRNLFDEAEHFSRVDQCLYVDMKSYLCNNILTKVDRMSMANSLEARVPFLDKDLVELAFQIPDHLKVKVSARKVLLKRIAARHLPAEIVSRPKQGFSIPIKNWLKTTFRPLLEDYLDENVISGQGLFNAGVVAQLKAEHLSGSANHSHILWSLIVFQAWMRRWADAPTPENAA